MTSSVRKRSKILMALVDTLRDRCLITMLYEGGLRIG
jgi:hypothetical protein